MRKLSTEDGISIKRVKLTLNEADDVNIELIDPLIPPQVCEYAASACMRSWIVHAPRTCAMYVINIYAIECVLVHVGAQLLCARCTLGLNYMAPYYAADAEFAAGARSPEPH